MLPASSNPGATSVAPPEPTVTETKTAVEERRASKRADRKVTLQLKGMGCTETHLYTTKDICEGGLFLHVPVENGLAVGQRVEVVLGDETESPRPLSFAGETHYATVVRTELLAEAAKPTIGAGLRFDQPLFL